MPAHEPSTEGSEWVRIEYRDFYDYPRIFAVRLDDGRVALFDSAFEPTTDDFPDEYTVYRLTADSPGQALAQ